MLRSGVLGGLRVMNWNLVGEGEEQRGFEGGVI